MGQLLSSAGIGGALAGTRRGIRIGGLPDTALLMDGYYGNSTGESAAETLPSSREEVPCQSSIVAGREQQLNCTCTLWSSRQWAQAERLMEQLDMWLRIQTSGVRERVRGITGGCLRCGQRQVLFAANLTRVGDRASVYALSDTTFAASISWSWHGNGGQGWCAYARGHHMHG